MQEKVLLDKKTIESYLKEGVKQEPEMMIDLLVDKVYVYEDHLELILNYIGIKPKPKHRVGERTENPEGKDLRGSLIFTTEVRMEICSYHGCYKRGYKPKLKTVCEKIFIEI